MRLKVIIKITSLVLLLLSCNNKNSDKNNILENNFLQKFYQDNIENTFTNEYDKIFSQLNTKKVEIIHPIEYYENEIIKYEDNYYGFKDMSMEITQMMNISQIIEVDNFVPNLLVFLVSWFNAKGYIFYLYTFNDNQKIVAHYYCGDMVPFENHKILMKKIGGKKFEYGNISIGDFNNDEVNEIVLYSCYKNIGYVFCVYGFDIVENKLEELLLVHVFINFENPFPSVEYIENGFKILEIVDEEYFELAWNNYLWDNAKRKYTK